MKTIVIAVALALLASPASAVTTTKFVLANAGWTDLGTGPLLLGFAGSGVYAISDTTPSFKGEGFTMISGDSVSLNTASHVWAMSPSSSGVSAYVAPISP